MPYFDNPKEIKNIIQLIKITEEDLKNFNEKQTKEKNFTDFEINEPTNQIKQT